MNCEIEREPMGPDKYCIAQEMLEILCHVTKQIHDWLARGIESLPKQYNPHELTAMQPHILSLRKTVNGTLHATQIENHSANSDIDY